MSEAGRPGITIACAEVLSSTMLRQRIPFSATACLIAALVCSHRAFAEEPGCATNYRNDGRSAETFVLTSLTPQAVVERLPWLLVAAGVTMQWAEPARGVIKAEGLDVKAETTGDATRVTFHSSQQPAADKNTLCRYAALVGNPPLAKKPAVAQDPVLIAQIKDDLLKKHQIIQPVAGRGLNNAAFFALSDFLELVVTDMKVEAGKREYEISMLLPRASCGIASEDLADASLGFAGRAPDSRTKPARVGVRLVYEGEGAASHLTEAIITQIESTK
jgi:hypothetical protein